MVIYGDILFILNMIVDYLLLALTAALLRRDIRLYRLIIASVIGGLSAFYIFLDTKSIVIDLLFRIAVCFLMCAVAFGFRKIVFTLKATLLNFGLAMTLSGLCEAVNAIIDTEQMMCQNTFFYVGISPLILIILSVLFYFVVKIVMRIRKNEPTSELCFVDVFLDGESFRFSALVDSGCNVTDLLSNSEIFIASKNAARKLLGTGAREYMSLEENRRRGRIIPTNTVNGESLLYAVRCDKAKISDGKIYFEIEKPIIAESEFLNNDEYELVIPKGVFKGR